jgi:hypothetical protein
MYPKLDFEKVKRRVMWDFRLEDEEVAFQKRRTGYAFIIDVLDGTPRLAIYHVTRFGSKTEYFDLQPPQEMLVKALAEQGASLSRDGLYNINHELRVWAEENLL